MSHSLNTKRLKPHQKVKSTNNTKPKKTNSSLSNSAIKEVVIPKKNSKKLITALKNRDFHSKEEDCFFKKKDHQSIIESTLPSDVLHKIHSFYHNSSSDILILRSLMPNMPIPPTPINQNDNRDVIKIFSAGMIEILNYGEIDETPYQKKYIDEGSRINPIVHQVFSWEKNKNNFNFSSRGSSNLDFHSDRALTSDHLSTPTPDVLAFFGLRCDKNVPTRIILNDDIFSKIDQDTFNALKVNQFHITNQKSSNATQPNDHDSSIGKTIPIVTMDNNNNPVIRWGGKSIVSSCNSKKSKDAMKKLMCAIEQCEQYHIILEPGDFMMFKNKRVLHAREAYQPKYDGNDRWLLRVYGLFKKRIIET